MRLTSLIRFSWKNLWVHRLRSLLTVGGVVIGVAAIVFLVSLAFGLERLVTSQVANFSAFTIIDVPSANPPSGKINQESIDRLKGVAHVEVLERVIDLAGRAKLANSSSTTETVIVAAQPSYYDLAEISLQSGKLYRAEATNEALVNASLASLLGFTDDPLNVVGQSVAADLIIPESLRLNDDVDGPLVKEGLLFTVVGLLPDSQNPAMYIPLGVADAQGVVNSTAMKVKVDDKEFVPTVRKQIENAGFATEYIGDTVDQITSVFTVFRMVLGGFGSIALIVAALGTFNTLTISLIERIREIALLKMLGMQRKDVFRLFIAESLTIGIVGGILGAIAGYLTGWGANYAIRILAERANADAVQIFYTPPIFLLYTGIGSIIVGFVTGLYPSWRAIKTNPLDALRYE